MLKWIKNKYSFRDSLEEFLKRSFLINIKEVGQILPQLIDS